MSEHIELSVESDWKRFIHRHWGVFTLFVAACVATLADATYVFTWTATNAETSGSVPTALATWTMSNLITLILSIVFWEFVFVGIPVIMGAIAAWWWWRRLPPDERLGYHFFEKRSSSPSGDGASVLFFLAFCIKVYTDGNWNTAISSWTLDYVVGSMITIFVWTLIIFAVPMTIVFAWWIRRNK